MNQFEFEAKNMSQMQRMGNQAAGTNRDITF